MAHVGDIHHMLHLIAQAFQAAAQDVFENIAAVIADVKIIVDRGSAGIKSDRGRMQRLKVLLGAPPGVEELEHSLYFSLYGEGQRNRRDRFLILQTWAVGSVLAVSIAEFNAQPFIHG